MASSQYYHLTATATDYSAYLSAVDGPADMSQDSVTMAMWINMVSVGDNPIFAGIGVSTNSGHQNWITMLASKKFRYDVKSTGQTSIDSVLTYDLDTWYFITTVSYANNDHRLFVDGIEVANSTATKTYTLTPNRWAIGRNAGSSNFTEDNDGYIAYPQFFDRGLSVEEINEIMHKPYSIGKGLVWAPDMLVNSPSVVGDIKDLGPGGFDCNDGTIPTSQSTLGPPVYFPEIIEN